MITVLGSDGFVGSHLIKELVARNLDYFAPGRDQELRGKNLGNVIYCIGLTSDFRFRPFETVEAHICKLKYILEACEFDSLTYLSSTRIYIHNKGLVDEDSEIVVKINEPFDLFNISKIAGESLALNCGRSNIRIARLSNVYGRDVASENFISSIIKEAINTGKVIIRSTPESAKDYISIDAVVNLLLGIATEGKQVIYNVASGVNVANDSILSALKKATGCSVLYEQTLENIVFPLISVDRLNREFNYRGVGSLISDFDRLVDEYRNSLLQ